MSIPHLTERAMTVRNLYAQLEQQRYGKSWDTTDLMLGFVGDVGELAQLVQAATGTRNHDGELTESLGHELADCLWSVLVLAHQLDIDLEAAFESTMSTLEERVTAKLAQH
jgi:NTP pyrophosphatase (non-canonical NTP hydrolase)